MTRFFWTTEAWREYLKRFTLLGLLLLIAFSNAPAQGEDVVLTRGFISGTIHFEADFVPAYMRVDVANPPNEAQRFTAQTFATFVRTTPTGSEWSYTITVEAQETNNYFVRPVAFKSSPIMGNSRAAFPESGPVSVTPQTTTNFDISYAPVVVSGVIEARDMNGALLPLDAFLLVADNQAPWGPDPQVIPDTPGRQSPLFSASASLETLSFPPNTTEASYQLYLKPGRVYRLWSQGITIEGVYMNINSGESFTAPDLGPVIRDYRLQQKAAVQGKLTLPGVSVSSTDIMARGTTAAGLPFNYRGNNTSVGEGKYLLRFFDNLSYPTTIDMQPRFDFETAGAAALMPKAEPVSLAEGEVLIRDFEILSSVISGRINFSPTYPLLPASPLAPGWFSFDLMGPERAESWRPPDTATGGYRLIVSPGRWDRFRFGVNFDLGDPNFSSTYRFIDYLLMNPVEVTGGGEEHVRDFNFDTALVKVFLSVADGSPLSDPELEAVINRPAREVATGKGLNQTNVPIGEAKVVLLDPQRAPFDIRASALVTGQTSRTDFGLFRVSAQPGDVIVIGARARLTLTVRQPAEGETIVGSQVPVEGLATDDQGIASITVNGQPISFESTNNPQDPREVSFSTVLSGSQVAIGPNALTITVTDTDGNQISQTVNVIVADFLGPETSNTAAAPNPVAVNTPVTVTANVDDSTTGGSDITLAEYSFDGGPWVPTSVADGVFDEVSEDVIANIGSFATPGVHRISVRGTDSAGNVGDVENILLAVYDPMAGFVTGGGWINSPEGAFTADPDLIGKAIFGFVSKYQRGATAPTGQTEFQFRVANLNFHSSSYQWLVISGAKAQYKGSGTINGEGDYGFMLTAIDSQLNNTGIDKFRIKIWDKATDAVVYDNKLGAPDTGDDATALGAGSIVIHKM